MTPPGRQPSLRSSMIAAQIERLVKEATKIAERLETASRTVHQRQRRYPDSPQPVARLSQPMVWAWPDVERWVRTTGRLP